MAAETQPTLFDRLRESELLEQGTLDELGRLPEARDPDPRALGKVLYSRKLLSKWQINLLAQGKLKELRLGKYVLLDKLGEGGMGQVLKARDRRMGRTVALKVIKKDRLANEDSVRRFYQEVQAAAALNHPNIATAFDADEAGGTHYFAMEFLDGTDLARQVREAGPLGAAQASEYARQAALGLQHAHEKGLVHRDIKPHNLMLTTGPGGKAVVKLLDMGLARLAQQGETGLTRSGQVLGTPDYLAPEQAFDSRKADARSDVYSLGCTLYFLLTGSAPFTGDTLTQVLLKHQMEQALPLAQRRPGLPAALSAVVAKMMAKDPADRYQSAAEVADALEPLSRGEAGAAPPPPVPARPSPFDSTDAWGDLESDGGVIKASRSLTRADDGKPSRSVTRADDDAPRRRRDAGEEDAGPNKMLLIGAAVGVPVVFLLVIGLVLLMWPASKPSGGPGKVAGTKEKKDKDGKPEPKDGEKDGEKDGPKDGDKEQPKDGGARPVPMPVDPPVGPEPKALATFPGRVRNLFSVTPDGRTVVSIAGSRIQRLDLQTGASAEVPVKGPGRGVRYIKVLPDGNRAFVLFQDEKPGTYKPCVVSLETGELVGEGDAVGSGWPVDVSPDGRLAVVTSQRFEAPGRPPAPEPTRLLDLTNCKVIRELGTPEQGISFVGFTPDSKRLLLRDFRAQAHLWDVPDGKEPTTRALIGHTTTPVFTADGKRVGLHEGPAFAVHDLEGGVRRLPLDRFSGSRGCVPWGDGRHALIAQVLFKNDGTRTINLEGGQLIEVGAKVQLIDMQELRVAKEIPFPDHHFLRALAPLGDGKRFVAQGNDGTLRVYSFDGLTPTPMPMPVPPGTPDRARPVMVHRHKALGPLAPSHDGATLVVFPTDRVMRLSSRGTGAIMPPFPDSRLVDRAECLPDGNVVVTVKSADSLDATYKLKVIDPATGKVIREFDPLPPHQVVSLDVSRDGKHAAVITRRLEKIGKTSGRLVDYAIRLYDVSTGKVGPVLDPKESTTRALQFTPDGKRIVSAGSSALSEWNVADGSLIRTSRLPLSTRDSLALTPDGQRAAVLATSAKLMVWDLNRRELMRTIELGSDVTAYHALPTNDNRHVLLRLQARRAAGGESDPKMALLDLDSGRIVREFPASSSILRAAVSADGKTLFTCDPFGVISVWDVEAPKAEAPKPPDPPSPGEKPLARHPIQIDGPIAVSADGRWVTAVGNDGLLRLETEPGTVTKVALPEKVHITHLASEADGKHVLAAVRLGEAPNFTQFVRRIEAATGKTVREFDPLPHDIYGLDLSPDGTRAAVATGHYDRDTRRWVATVVRLFDVSTGKVLHTLDKHTNRVTGVRFSHDGKRLVSLASQELRIWNVVDGTEVRADRLPIGCEGTPALSPDGRRALLRNSFNLVWWDLEKGELIKQIPREADTVFLSSAAWSDGRHAVVGTYVRKPDANPTGTTEPKVRLLDLEAGRFVREFPIDDLTHKLVVSADGKRLYVADNPGTLTVWDFTKPAPAVTPIAKPTVFQGHTGTINDIAIAPDGSKVATGGQDGTLRLWDPSGKELLKITEPSAVRSVSFSADSSMVCGLTADGPVKVYSAVKGDTLKTAPRFKDADEACVILPDGTSFATGRGQRVSIRLLGEAAPSRSIVLKTLGSVRSMACTGSPRLLAVGDSEGAIHIINLLLNKVIQVYPTHKGAVTALAFSADGTRLVSGGEDTTIVVRHVKSGDVRKITGHTGTVTGLAVPSSGKFVVSSSRDRTVRVWSVSKGEALKLYRGHEEAVTGVILVPKTARILSAGDGVREWELPAALGKP